MKNIIDKILSIRNKQEDIDYSQLYKKLETKEEIENWLKDNNLSDHKVNDDLTVDVNVESFSDYYFKHNIVFFPFNISKKSTEEWLEKNDVKNYHINDDLTVDVKGDVYLKYPFIRSIPVQFGHVTGNFECQRTDLRHTNNFPKRVDGSVSISATPINSLYGMTEEIGRNFYCSGNPNLTSLKHGPKSVKDLYAVWNTPIKNLKELDCEIEGKFAHRYVKDGVSEANKPIDELKGLYGKDKEFKKSYEVELPGNELKQYVNLDSKSKNKLR